MSFHKVSEVESTHDHYSVDACVVSCIDQRFADAQRRYQEEQGWKTVDPITVAGAAKGLTGDYDDPVVQHYLWQIEASIKLHNAKLVVLEVHENCGAYGGEIKEGEEAEEIEERELVKAKANVERFLNSKNIEGVKVKLLAVCHKGIKELD